MAAQIIHATGQSTTGHPPDTYAGALMRPDEPTLQRLADWLEARGVALVRVVESDGPYAGQLMALGVSLGRKEALRRHLSSLPLLR